MNKEVPEWLLKRTFCVEYNPNCFRPWLVRFAGESCIIDKKQYAFMKDCTSDILGFGTSLIEAAQKALKAEEEFKHRNKFLEKAINTQKPTLSLG